MPINGVRTKIDSSRDRNYPFAFNLGKSAVIKGWEEAIPKLAVGDKALIICPPDQAYGAQGIAGIIPPNTTL